MPQTGWRVEGGRLAGLLGASGLAIGAPVLSAFGESPETFVFRNAEGLDLVLFGLAVVLVPPIALWWVGLVVAMWAPGWRVLVHGASIGLLVGLAVVQALPGLARPLAVALAVLVAVVAWVLTVRAAPFRLWGQFLAGLPAFSLIAFLLASPASDLLANGGFTAAASSGATAPVVLIILDELPTASIIDADGAIDDVRFPNLARLASQSTWYRNHTTRSGFTASAVPAIFTGRRPVQVPPLHSWHPDSIFSLLAGSHDLVSSESLTRICPTSVCGDTPQAPTGSSGSDDDRDDGGAAMGDLFGDAFDLWLDRVGGADDGPNLGEFEEEVEVAVETPAAASSGAGEPPTEPGTWQEAVAAQPSRLTSFMAALHPGDRPLAAVLHLVSPHWPWRYLPDGTEYAETAEGADLPINGDGDPWVANLERQRHLLQASYTDRLLGQILQRLEESEVFDDAVVVVTADHGVAFHGDPNRRLPVPEALPEIMWTPLLVKTPGQTEARIDDANVESIDVLPTLAALLGVEIPWDVDGIDVADGVELAQRGDTKEFRRFTSDADPTPASDLEVDGAAGFAAMLDLWFPPIGPADDPIAALHTLSGRGDLVGQPFEPTRESGASVAVDELDRLLEEDLPVLVLTGTVDDGGRGDYVVASLDGEIIAVSPVIERNIGGRAFALLLPTDRDVDLGEVHLGVVTSSGIVDAGPLRG